MRERNGENLGETEREREEKKINVVEITVSVKDPNYGKIEKSDNYCNCWKEENIY